MKTFARAAIGLLLLTAATGAAPAAAPAAAPPPKPRAVLTLPATGTFAAGGEFNGTISINRFERRGNAIVAIGFVAGVLSRGSVTLGTTVAGELAIPVHVSSGGISIARDRVPAAAPAHGKLLRVALSPDMSSSAVFRPVQAETCPVLNIALGPLTVDLLGVQVALSPVTLDLTGVVGTPLGDLVCSASDLLGQVAAVVNLLNSVLGLVTGLLGGLLGGLGGLGGGLGGLGGGVPPIQ
jgi:hypothetical protein